MKRTILAIFCAIAMAILGAGCSMLGDSQPTQPATQPPTQEVTQPPTEAPTQPPTEAPTEPPTEAPTQPQVQEPENTTFSVSVSQAPTETPTQPPTTVPQTVELLKPIIGDWYLDHYLQSNGQQTTPGATIAYTFHSDGTFAVNNRGNISTGAYYFDGKKISYVADASGETGEFAYDSTQNQITDVDESSNMSAVFTRTKPE
ncbi:MAG: hypothetical protein II233_00415 [Clostridia bacterium]|nr:hypothetical protein [Clostridia bacterium]MEE1125505.1 hypothetical protein [Acutalibacteraceae bacterium]